MAAVAVGGGRRLPAEQPQRRQQPQQEHGHPAGQEERGQPRPDVVERVAARPQPDGRRPQDHQQHAAGLLLTHSSTRPTTSAQASATTKVSGANRAANRRPNMPDCIAISLTSTAGPTTRKTSRAVSENSRRLAATNASASEQIASSTASPPRARAASAGWSATASTSDRGTSTWSVAAAAAPTTS